MENMEKIKIDRNGWEYYDKLPDGFRLATIDDFLIEGKRKIGMLFLIRWRDNTQFYQICYVSMGLNSHFLAPFMKDDRVFVKD